MSNENPGTSTDTPKEKPLTREQKRWRERTNAEAQQTIQSLQSQFLNFFMECQDPEGESVVNKMKEISAKWRLYCKRKNLVPAAYPVMDKYMEDSIKEYYLNKEQEKAGKIETRQDQPEIELSNSQQTDEKQTIDA